MGKKRFYAYKTEDREGITTSWGDCERFVKGRKALFKGFNSLDEAYEWLHSLDEKIGETKEDLSDAIFFDSGTGRTGLPEINVTDKDGKPLLEVVLDREKLTERGTLMLGRGKTNNYGELLACKLAIEVANKLGKQKVAGDSSLVIDYWSKGRINPKTAKRSEELGKLAVETSLLRQEFEKSGGRVVFIGGGRNPADLGFHKD